MKDFFQNKMQKAKSRVLWVIGILALLSALFGSMAFVYPQNRSIDIALKVSMDELGPDYQANQLSDDPIDVSRSRMAYAGSGMGSHQIAGILSETGKKVLSYHESLLEKEKKDSEVMGQSQTASQTASQPAPVSHASLNGYESQVLALINAVRAEHGLGQLAAVQSLTDVARTRSADMLARDYFSHHTPEGSTVFHLLRAAGIGYSYGGENLAHSYPASAGSADAFLHAWLNSPSHRANMLKSQYTKIGIGLAENGGRRVVTTVFTN